VSAACADPAELVDGGLPAVGVDASTGTICIYSSDCPGDLYCLHGVCAPQCATAKDCALGWGCVDAICRPPGAFDSGVHEASVDAGGGG
jgi:hypothetical protein